MVNRCLKTYLRCFTPELPSQWVSWLPWAEYWYNTSFLTSAKAMPFLVLYGRDPPHLVYYGKVKTVVGTVDQYLEERDRMLQEIKRHLPKAQQKMKKHADGHRRNENCAVGDRVYLKLRPYRQRTMARRVNEKLAP